jgi:N-methylhydantoinase A/oxoprolinase/acetone carboxylase beta subunit
MPLLLGIDTGGTFTDAVLLDEGEGVVAKAKALTTHGDLAEGIGNAIAAVIGRSRCDPAEIALVSLSTTLATNAMVEGQGGRVGLVLIGFDAADAARPNLKAALGGDPVILVAGGHDPFGSEIVPLDAGTLADEARKLAPSLTGFAVTGRFGVLNAAHETAARDVLRAETHLPVTCSHELSARLDGPKRALTALLNARLVHLLERLIAATEERLSAHGIAAPLMVVRGDGALVSSSLARTKPIETIFSGPAASAVGGAFLAGQRDALVADIGGTTTDVVVLRDGRPRIDPAGALIGGFRTMVEAIAIRTCGLGGDSEVGLAHHSLQTELTLGPRRVVPLSLLAAREPALVHETLDRQLAGDRPGELDGRFVVPLRQAGQDLATAESTLLARIGSTTVALDRFLAGRREMALLGRLVARRAVILSALTPSDAAHCLGLHQAWDRAAAEKGAALFARRRNAAGQPVAASGAALARSVVDRLVRQSADFVLDCAFAEDGLPAEGLSSHPLAVAALEGRAGLARLSIDLTVPLVGLGAAAQTYYPDIARRLGAASFVPDHAEVANAVGAVVGGVHASAEVKLVQPAEGVFRVLGYGAAREVGDKREALSLACDIARGEAAAAALQAGAASVETSVTIEERKAETEGREIFVEAIVVARAWGRPRMG